MIQPDFSQLLFGPGLLRLVFPCCLQLLQGAERKTSLPTAIFPLFDDLIGPFRMKIFILQYYIYRSSSFFEKNEIVFKKYFWTYQL